MNSSTRSPHWARLSPWATVATAVLLGSCNDASGCSPGTAGCECAVGVTVSGCTAGLTCSAENVCVADPNAQGAMADPLSGAPATSTITGVVLGGDPPPTAGGMPPATGTQPEQTPMGQAGSTGMPQMNAGGAGTEPDTTGASGAGMPAGGEAATPNGGTSAGGADNAGGSPQTAGGAGMPMETDPAEDPDVSVVANPCDGAGTDDCDAGCTPAENAGAVYMLCDASAAKRWEAAREHCLMHDMRLARLSSLAEYEWLGSLVYPMDHPEWVAGEFGTRVWIGLSNQGDDTFQWEDGSPLDFVAWAPDEPSFSYEGVEENCVHYWNYPPDLYDILNDADCNEAFPYACQRY